MSKKHVKAPLTYDPGKGRPKEHLAYLNYQEMQALMRLNGNNKERGPKNLPSFPPADATSGKNNSGYGTGGTKSGGGGNNFSPRGNTGNYPSRGDTKGQTPKSSPIGGGGNNSSPRGNTGNYPSRGNTQGQTPKSGPIGGGGNNSPRGNTANYPSRGSISKAVSAPMSGGRTGFKGAGTNTADQMARQVTAARDAVKVARETPAYRGDLAKVSAPQYSASKISDMAKQYSQYRSPPSSSTFGQQVSNYAKSMASGIGSLFSSPAAAATVAPGTKPSVPNQTFNGLFSGLENYTIGDAAMRNALTADPVAPGSPLANRMNYSTTVTGADSIISKVSPDGFIQQAPAAGLPKQINDRVMGNIISDAEARLAAGRAQLAHMRSIENQAPADLTQEAFDRANSGWSTPYRADAIQAYRDRAPEFSASPSQQAAGPTYDQSVSQQELDAIARNNKITNRAGTAAKVVLNAVVPFGGTLLNKALQYADDKVQQLVNRYQGASVQERAAMEKAYPNLIAHANQMGITTGGGTMADYRDWADKSGLRSPPSREGGGRDASTGLAPKTAPSGGTPTDRGDNGSGSNKNDSFRPYIYYQWDLGVNIPSPSDSNYTMYRQYLAERAAAERAMYG